MNPFVYEVTCDVCGEGGMSCEPSNWDASVRTRHCDPQVCADNLQWQAEKMKRREEELKKKESALKAPYGLEYMI